MEFEQYIHHGSLVWVRKDLKGTHSQHCLCHVCDRFHPNESNNCPIAQANYENCVKYNIVTPVFECPDFGHLKQ